MRKEYPYISTIVREVLAASAKRQGLTFTPAEFERHFRRAMRDAWFVATCAALWNMDRK